jgi:hypothetical protein
VTGADSVVLILSAATSMRHKDPLATADAQARGIVMNYDAVRAAHVRTISGCSEELRCGWGRLPLI